MPAISSRIVRTAIFGTLGIVGIAMFCSRADFRAVDEARGAEEGTLAGKTQRAPTAPQYDEKGELRVPTDFYTWVFVGSNLGIEYREAGAPDDAKEKDAEKRDKPRNFHNVYINPEAYEHYARTGEYPEKTVLILDMYRAEEGEPKNVVSDGKFPGRRTGFAAAVKNSARPDGAKTNWAYYEFGLDKTTAKAFPNSECFDCHLQHADEDNVWTRFYPTLRRLHGGKPKR